MGELKAGGFRGDSVFGYDDRIPRSIPGYEAMHDLVSAILTGLLPEEGRLLVVGAGTGKEIITLGTQNKSWRFTGVDPSKDMLAVARKSLKPLSAVANSRICSVT